MKLRLLSWDVALVLRLFNRSCICISNSNLFLNLLMSLRLSIDRVLFGCIEQNIFLSGIDYLSTDLISWFWFQPSGYSKGLASVSRSWQQGMYRAYRKHLPFVRRERTCDRFPNFPVLEATLGEPWQWWPYPQCRRFRIQVWVFLMVIIGLPSVVGINWTMYYGE